MSSPLRIRDPVHGYVGVTAIERELLDQPVTQRLRWVAQSGLSQLVFPEVRTSRFTHSLGAMHLASRFLTSALSNLTPGAKTVVDEGLRRLVENADQDVELGDDIVGTLQSQGLTASTAVDVALGKHALVAEQALRLAALFHDLGHLPFSHDFEYVLRDLIVAEQPDNEVIRRLGDAGKPPHEKIGYAMAELLQRSVFDTLSGDVDLRGIVSPAFKLARQILFANPSGFASGDPEEAVLSVLHTLIDGELDIDRTDYLLRDARAYGFEYVSFELDRLADNLAIAATDGGGLELVVRAQAQSAVESFLFARLRMYQWGVFHHKVVQVGAALRHVTQARLVGATADGHAYNDFLSTVAVLADPTQPREERSAALAKWSEWDDVWWTTQLRMPQPRDAWTAMLLSRRRGPCSLWKRESDFPLGQEGVVELNRRLPARGENDRAKAWDEVRRQVLDEHGVLLERAELTPLRTTDEKESALRILVEDELVPLSAVSYIVAHLNEAWGAELQVFAFAPEPPADPNLARAVAQLALDALPER